MQCVDKTNLEISAIQAYSDNSANDEGIQK